MVAKQVVSEFRAGSFDVLWVVFDGSLGPFIEQLLLVDNEIPLHVSLHDEPVGTASRCGHDVSFIRSIQHAITLLAQLKSLTVDSVTNGLIRDVLGPEKRGVLVTLHVQTESQKRFRSLPKEGPLVFGYSGNYYGHDEMRALIRGFDRWSASTGRAWEMQAYGDAGLSSISHRIVAHGPTSFSEVQNALGRCHCLVLPCPIDRPESRTNLPTKLVSYTELGLPIIACCPGGSETDLLLRKTKLGPVSNSISDADIDTCIDQLAVWNWAEAAIGHAFLTNELFSKSRILEELRATLVMHSTGIR